MWFRYMEKYIVEKMILFKNKSVPLVFNTTETYLSETGKNPEEFRSQSHKRK